jgi:dihydroorotase
MHEIVIIDGTVVTPATMAPATIGITNGAISAVVAPHEPLAGHTVITAGGKLILPGLIDAHVHIPGWLLSKSLDNFTTATQAAAAGGVTTVLLMPTDDPRTVSAGYFRMKIAAGINQSHVDFGIQAMATPWMEDLRGLADLGPVSYEVFLSYGGSPRFIVGADDYDLLRVMQMIKDVDGIAAITPHSPTLNNRLAQEHREDPEPDVRTIAKTRPILSEALGMSRACTVARAIGSKIHIRSVSTKAGLDILRCFREHMALSCEAMSHHLVFQTTEAEAMGPYGVITPPIRHRDEQEHLVRGVASGEIDMVVSDHSPALKAEKEKGWKNIWDTPPGMTGLQTLIYSMLKLVDEKRLTLRDVARLCGEMPARKFGLFPRKGSISVGADADLIVLDPARACLIRDEDQLSRANYTTLAGYTASMTVDRVLLRGRTIYKNGSIVGPASGTFVKPQ